MDLRKLSDEEIMQLAKAEAESQSINAGRKPHASALRAKRILETKEAKPIPEPAKLAGRRSARS